MRRTRPHLLAEGEERVLAETSVVGAGAWVRLFEEQTSAIEVALPEELGGTVPLMHALSLLQHPERTVRASAAAAVNW